MTYRIAKTFSFDAAHQLPDLPDGHKCARLHGHTYSVTLTLVSNELTAPGFVVDFADLSFFKMFLDDTLDHRNLNDVLPIPPTSERIAEYLYQWVISTGPEHVATRLESVRVSETPSTWAEYHP